ncbi:glycosyl transferase group 1, partial [mine drainage metagenome]
METLRIAIYSDTYLPTRDGVVTYVLTLRRELEKLGHEAIIATTASHPGSIKDSHVFTSRGYRFPLYPQYSISPVPFSVNRKILDRKIDIVHSQTPLMMGYAALRYSRSKGIPIVSTFHSLIFDESILKAYLPDNRRTINVVNWNMRRYLGWYYKRCGKTIVPSEYVKQILSREISIDALVVNNAIDIEKYMSTMTKSEARALLHMDESSRIVMFLGRISREKN